MNGLLPLLGAGLAVALLMLLAARLGFRGVPQLSCADEARQLATSLSGGFKAVELALDQKLHGALLSDHCGRVALIAPFGAHFLARELAPRAPCERLGGQLTFRIDGRELRLDLGDEANRWQARIVQAGASE